MAGRPPCLQLLFTLAQNALPFRIILIETLAMRPPLYSVLLCTKRGIFLKDTTIFLMAHKLNTCTVKPLYKGAPKSNTTLNNNHHSTKENESTLASANPQHVGSGPIVICTNCIKSANTKAQRII